MQISHFLFLRLQGKITELFSQGEPDLKYFFVKNEDGNVEIATRGRITNYEASITLPKSISDRLTGRGRLEAGLFLSYYDTASLFPERRNSTRSPEEEELASPSVLEVSSVVAATFVGEELQNLEDDVTIAFKLEADVTTNLTCVSWDFRADGENRAWKKCCHSSLFIV
jgi:hypothetical protein